VIEMDASPMATGSRDATAEREVVAMPDLPGIAGIRVRPFDIGRDLDALVELIFEANVADGEEYAPSVEDFRTEIGHRAHFDPGRDMLIAEIDGRLVGATEHSVELRAGVVQHQVVGWVRPDVRRRGIGRALLHWTERRAREAATEWAGHEPHGFASRVGETQPGAIALLESEGYRRGHNGYTLTRPLSEPIPDTPLPAGLEVRPVVESDHRRILDADAEACRDHWVPFVHTEEDFASMMSVQGIDTSIWRVAWAGEEVAGCVMNYVFADENEKLGIQRGWIAHVSVRRPYRRIGLADALIAESLRALRDKGLDQAALDVDAEDLSGALHLYESFGFRRSRTGISFRKPFLWRGRRAV
jgi:mycothiol synthase